MATPTTTEVDPRLRLKAARLLAARHLGPVDRIETQTEPSPAVVIWASETAAAKSVIVERWLKYLRVIDMVVGRFRRGDATAWLSLRGQMAGHLFIVGIPFSNPDQVAILDERIGRLDEQDPYALCASLADAEPTR